MNAYIPTFILVFCAESIGYHLRQIQMVLDIRSCIEMELSPESFQTEGSDGSTMNTKSQSGTLHWMGQWAPAKVLIVAHCDISKACEGLNVHLRI